MPCAVIAQSWEEEMKGGTALDLIFGPYFSAVPSDDFPANR
jgi:hypothetical protein